MFDWPIPVGSGVQTQFVLNEQIFHSTLSEESVLNLLSFFRKVVVFRRFSHFIENRVEFINPKLAFAIRSILD